MIFLDDRIAMTTVSIDEDIIKKINGIRQYEFKVVENRPHRTMNVPYHGDEEQEEVVLEVKNFVKRKTMDTMREFADLIGFPKDLKPRPNILVSVLDEGRYMESHKDREKSIVTMFYLNSCVGGDLVFDDLDLSINTTEGTVIYFVGDQYHSVLPIIKGNKYSIAMGHYYD